MQSIKYNINYTIIVPSVDCWQGFYINGYGWGYCCFCLRIHQPSHSRTSILRLIWIYSNIYYLDGDSIASIHSYQYNYVIACVIIIYIYSGFYISINGAVYALSVTYFLKFITITLFALLKCLRKFMLHGSSR